MNITKGSIFKYVFLPQVIPRFRDLFASGFHNIPYFMALVYQIVRLLPATHPYLDPKNIGNYGIRHVIAEASSNLVFRRENLDQILIFFLILLGLGLILVQICLLAFGIIAPAAMAQALSFSKMFVTQDPEQDLAFMMLDMVFGVKEMFNSCVSTMVSCVDSKGQAIQKDNQWILSHMGFPFAAHHGLHAMFRFYSYGLLVVAVLITSYFMATVVAETAQTGTPFGKRFNKVWAPIRLVVAFGLLIPVGVGMNSAQYIVLYAAKFGSSFATNGWEAFNEKAASGPKALVQDQSYIAAPSVPDMSDILKFLYVARICAEADYVLHSPGRDQSITNIKERGVGMYLVKDNWYSGKNPLKIGVDGTGSVNSVSSLPHYSDTPNQRKNKTLNISHFTTYKDLIAFANGAHHVTVRFGVHDPKEYNARRGYVEPICGEISFNLLDPRDPESTTNPPERGAEIMQRIYWYLLQYTWFYAFYFDQTDSLAHALNTFKYYNILDYDGTNTSEPDPQMRVRIREYYNNTLKAAIYGNEKADGSPVYSDIELDKVDGFCSKNADGQQECLGAMAEQAKVIDQHFDTVLMRKGWAGAAIWYNRIAEINGSFIAAVGNMPSIVQYPQVMQEILDKKKAVDEDIDPATRFEPYLSGKGTAINLGPKKDIIAQATWRGFQYWQNEGGASSHVADTGNAFENVINALLGTNGLFNLRANEGTHPLAQLVGVGRSLTQAAIRNLLVGVPASILLGSSESKTLSKIVYELTFTVAIIALTLGFVLFYVIPFMPFLYFFFALGGWVKGIFEAMVGAPLWALAHIRIDGNGLPGSAAINGYFLIFEIFIRPILIVFGLLASISTFSAMVNVLHEVWSLIVENVGGFDVEQTGQMSQIASQIATELGAEEGESLEDFLRSPIDEFFYTIMYAVVVYMMGMASFKMVDLIPNNILRWMGQSITTFNDQQPDTAQQLMGTSYIGGQQAISQIGGAAQSASKAASGTDKGG